MSAELGVALAKPRCQTEQDEIFSKWTELSTLDIDLTLFRPVYAPKDFLDILAQVKSPNLSTEQGGVAGARPAWGVINVPLRVWLFVCLP
jgi:hypothetical protein